MVKEIAEIVAGEAVDLAFGGLPISASLKIMSLLLQHECVDQSCPCIKKDCPKYVVDWDPDDEDEAGLLKGFEEFGEDLVCAMYDAPEVGCECCCSEIDDYNLISKWIKDNDYESTN